MKKIATSHWMTMLGHVELMLSETRKVEQAIPLDVSFGRQQKSSVETIQQKWFLLQVGNDVCTRLCETMARQ
jgi:hypothetical protein